MRLKRNRLKMYYHRAAATKKDNEGNAYIEYGQSSSFGAVIWPASGKLQVEMYGQRLSYIRNCRINGEYQIVTDSKGVVAYQFGDDMRIREGDGICVYATAEQEPDYRVIAIKPYKPLYLEMEKI